MQIIICKQNLYGGTDKLLDRLAMWLFQQKYDVETLGELENIRAKKFDLAIVPSSQMGDLWKLKKKGIQVDRVLVWILGMGAFYESYYNETQNVGLKKIPIKHWQKEASATLEWLYKNNSIIFTDEVGAYNTFRKEKLDYKIHLNDNLIPIAIEFNELQENDRKENTDEISIAWIGRVSSDFKEIPLSKLIDDINDWLLQHKQKIKLIVVGTGDAIDRVKNKCNNAKFTTQFIDEIKYDELSDFVTKNVDLLVAMGTSALDGAKVGCPTMIITPVRDSDPHEVYYRWIYESKGYSLGEFPPIDMETNQIRKNFAEVLDAYIVDAKRYGEKSYEYCENFEINNVFSKLMSRELPNLIDYQMWKHIKYFYKLKELKSFLKRMKYKR